MMENLELPCTSQLVWNLCDKKTPFIEDIGSTFLVLLRDNEGRNKNGSRRKGVKDYWCWHTDFARYAPGNGHIGDWNTENDWDEGQLVEIVAWADKPEVW